MQIASTAAALMPTATDLGKLAQRSTVAESGIPNILIERADSPEAKTKAEATFRANLDLFVQASSTPGRMGKDASDMAKALVSTMQSLVIDRPDLATKHFDFKLDQGVIKVVSQELSDKDKTWLEEKLNGNEALLNAAANYHDHATEGYSLWAKLNDQQISQGQLDNFSKSTNESTSFLDLFHRVGKNQSNNMFSDGTYYTNNGASINFNHDTKTAIGFLAFMQSVQAVTDGGATWVSPKGETKYGTVRGDPFLQFGALPELTPTRPSTLGLNQTA